MDNKEWMDNPILSGISPEKLSVLTNIIESADSKSPKELITYFVTETSKASKQGIYFNDDETNLIVDVLKQNMTEEEIKKIDTIRKLANMMAKKNKKHLSK